MRIFLYHPGQLLNVIGIYCRSGSSASTSRTSGSGPSSTIRPEINDLGSSSRSHVSSYFPIMPSPSLPLKNPHAHQHRNESEPPSKRLRANSPATEESPNRSTYISQYVDYDDEDVDMDTVPLTYEYSPEPTQPPSSNYWPPPPTARELPGKSPIPKVEPIFEFEIKLEQEDVKPKVEDLFEEPLIEPETDSDDDYERIHSGYDIRDESRVS